MRQTDNSHSGRANECARILGQRRKRGQRLEGAMEFDKEIGLPRLHFLPLQGHKPWGGTIFSVRKRSVHCLHPRVRLAAQQLRDIVTDLDLAEGHTMGADCDRFWKPVRFDAAVDLGPAQRGDRYDRFC